MDNNRSDNLFKDLDELQNRLGEKNGKRLTINLLKRVITRLESFSADCKECEQHLNELKDHIENLKLKNGQLEIHDYKEHRSKINKITSHLQKEHKLVVEGQYIGIYMSMGMSIGLIFGLLLFENIAIGMSFGLSIGVAIGASMDASAKKKGLTI